MNKTDILTTVQWWKRAKTKAVLLIILGIFLGISLGIGFIVATKTEPLYVNHDAKDKSLVVVDGRRLNVFYGSRVERECPIDTTRYLWTYYQLDNKKIKVYLFLNNSSASVGALTGDEEYVVSFQLPDGIWSGEWHYYSNTYDDCSFFKSLFRQQVIETYNFTFDIKNDVEKPDNDDIVRLITPKL